MNADASAPSAKPRPRKRRADCFFGLHFDHHARFDEVGLNDRVTEDLVRRIIELTRCDYIQHDCKGHPGIAGYPNSAAGVSPPGMRVDALEIYRRVTAEYGVNLYMHFSGVWDDRACQEHPEWRAVMREDAGSWVRNPTSTFGPYVHERMIPQMIEVIDRYKVDGFWVDGDCWAAAIDYCDAAKQRFRELTGQDEPPTAPDQPLWDEWLTIQRDQFFEYVRTYVDAVHRHDPHCEVCSNWLYSSHAPEPVRVAMDFVSGDYDWGDAVNRARVEGRLLANVGLPWDLMAWSFAWLGSVGGNVSKAAAQLQQEAAQVLALGGGFQLYFHPDRHGEFAPHELALMQEVAEFCHDRKAICWQSEPIGQVAMLLDSTSVLKAKGSVYGGGGTDPLHGALHAALEAGHACDVVADHQLNWQQDHFPVIVVPQWAHVPVSVVQELVAYAQRGGRLLLIGAETAGLFREHLGVDFVDEPAERSLFLQVDDTISRTGEAGVVPVKGLWQAIRLREDAPAVRPLAYGTPGQHPEIDRQIAATVAPLGEGKIAAVYGPFATAHLAMHTPWGRDLMDHLLRRLYQPIVTIDREPDPGPIDVVLRCKAGRTVIHLVNTTGMITTNDAHKGRYFFADRVPPTGPVTLRVQLAGKPQQVTLEPGGIKARTRWKASTRTLSVRVPPVEVHTAVAIR